MNRIASRLYWIALTLLTGLSVGCSESAPTAPTVAASPVSLTYSTGFPARGTAARLFRATQAGIATATLVSAGPPSTIVVGLGLGIPRADGAGCFPAQSILTSAGPDARVSARVDPGDYCVTVFDAGALTDNVTVTIALTHP